MAKGRRQLYKCHDCGRQFVGGKRLDTQDIIKDYVEGKQTLAQLAEKYGVNKSTIWRRIGCMRSIRVISRYKDSGDQYGYDLLGARLWADGDQGCVPQQDSVVQICGE